MPRGPFVRPYYQGSSSVKPKVVTGPTNPGSVTHQPTRDQVVHQQRPVPLFQGQSTQMAHPRTVPLSFPQNPPGSAPSAFSGPTHVEYGLHDAGQGWTNVDQADGPLGNHKTPIGYKCLVEMRIVGTPTSVLVDTGATCSVVSLDYLHCFPNWQRFITKEKPRTCLAVNGRPLHSLFTVKLPISLPGRKCIQHPFEAISGVMHSASLGTDFLKLQETKIDFSRNGLQLGSDFLPFTADKPLKTEKSLSLTCYSSGKTAECFLSLTDDQNKEGVIASASERFSDKAMRWSVFDKSFFAIVWGVRHFADNLRLIKFKIYTDHGPLLSKMYTSAAWDFSGRRSRWITELQKYNFKLRYKARLP